MKRKTRIMVMGAGGTAGINFISCLRMSKDNYYIVGCDINKWHLESCDADVKYVVPNCLEPGYLSIVNKIIEREKIDFIHAQPDMEVEELSENREKLKARYFLPKKETISVCRDKSLTNETLNKQKIPVPYSFRIKNIENMKDLIGKIQKRSGNPVVWLRAIKGAGSKAALPIKTFRQAKEWIHYWRSTRRLESKDFMLAEFLPGREYAFQSLWHNGQLVACQARQRLEYLMGNLFPSGQSSSPSVAVTVNNSLVSKIAVKAVLAIDKKPEGIFCVDLKENTASIPCVTEINAGRFFTTSNFFSSLGCNMPDYYVKLGMKAGLPDFHKLNDLPEGSYWIRSVDKLPVLIEGENWQSIDGKRL